MACYHIPSCGAHENVIIAHVKHVNSDKTIVISVIAFLSWEH